jgi:hypothetical protein
MDRVQKKNRTRQPLKPQKVAIEKLHVSRSRRGQGVATPCGVWGRAPQKEVTKRSYKKKLQKEVTKRSYKKKLQKEVTKRSYRKEEKNEF